MNCRRKDRGSSNSFVRSKPLCLATLAVLSLSAQAQEITFVNDSFDTPGQPPAGCGHRWFDPEQGAPAGYVESWRSDFSSMGEVAENWNSGYMWGADLIINNESQYYVDAFGTDADLAANWSPFSIVGTQSADGHDTGKRYLAIEATSAKNAGLPAERVAWQPYVSGVLTSRYKNGGDQNQGYFEARIRVARGNGTWTAFWLLNSNPWFTQHPEIDVLEYIGQSPYESTVDGLAVNWSPNTRHADGWAYAANKDGDGHEGIYHTFDTAYHTYWLGNGTWSTGTYPTNSVLDWHGNAATPEWFCASGTPVDFSERFHVYAVEWTQDRISWFIDGIKVHEDTTAKIAIPNEPMYAILNLATGSAGAAGYSWPGAPDAWTETAMDARNVKMYVDWVKFYRPSF